MKKVIVLFAAVCCWGMAVAGNPATHRIVSCNIRVPLAQDVETGDGWADRKAVCEKVMKAQKADIYCLQEVFGVQRSDLETMFSDYIALGYEGPEMDAMPDAEYFGIAKNVVLFSRERYELQSAGTYWLSETPLIGGSKSWDTGRARHVSWVRLKDLKTGKVFRVLSIHLDHVSQEARLAQIDAFMNEAAQYPAAFPQILAGDFNSKPGNPVMDRLSRAGWKDSFIEANGKEIDGGSTHAFKGESYVPKGKPGRIDFIFLKGDGVRCTESHLVKDAVDGKFPSDHYFLSADVVIE